MNKISLWDLFYLEYENLPELVDSRDCIYKITNQLNGLSYIGMTSWLFGRFKKNNWSHYNQVMQVKENYCSGYSIHKEIAKLGSKNFIVEVLETNLNNLPEREIYWIKYYNTFIKGYNMTSGGDHCEQLQSEEAQRKANLNQKSTKLLQAISDNIENLKLYSYEVNYYTYRIFFKFYKFYPHLNRILKHLDQLRKDSRWTREMEIIFKEYEKSNIPNPRSIEKILDSIESRLNGLKNLSLASYLNNSLNKATIVDHAITLLDNFEYLSLDPRVPKFLIKELEPYAHSEVTWEVYESYINTLIV